MNADGRSLDTTMSAPRVDFPAKTNTSKSDWVAALRYYFGVGVGMPRDWHAQMRLSDLSKVAETLRTIVIAPTNDAAIAALMAFEPMLSIKNTARICHTGNFLFALQQAKKYDTMEVVVLNWTRPPTAGNYWHREEFPRSLFEPPDPPPGVPITSVCRRVLTPIDGLGGLAVRVSCIDTAGRQTPIAVIAVGQGVEVQLELHVFNGCNNGVVGGLYLEQEITSRDTIEKTRGFPITPSAFFLLRGTAGPKPPLFKIEVNWFFDEWPGSKTKRLATLKNGGYLLGIDNSAKSAAVFQLNLTQNSYGIEEVPLLDDGKTPTRLLCKMPFDVAADLSGQSKSARYTLLDSVFDREQQCLYVAYELTDSSKTVNVRKVLRTPAAQSSSSSSSSTSSSTSVVPEFLQTEMIYRRVKPLERAQTYSFRRENTFVIAKLGVGFETNNLAPLPKTPPGKSPQSPIEVYGSKRTELDAAYVVPLEQSPAFGGQAYLVPLSDDDSSGRGSASSSGSSGGGGVAKASTSTQTGKK